MRILVLGASGMMGHMAVRVLSGRHEVFGAVRSPYAPNSPLARFLSEDRWVSGIDATRIDSITAAIATTRPDVVFNCIGIVKQLAEAHDPVLSIEINSLLPHRLSLVCEAARSRFIHMSTDCVFSGRRGNYSESDLPDPIDLYGRSKLLGETPEGPALTIRTSIVGRQILGATSLFEWILANRGNRVRGFERAIYTGLTTMALSEIVDRVIVEQPELTGVWQIASEPITKHSLLVELDRRLDLGLTVESDTNFECDRSLNGSAFTQRTGIVVPSWTQMLDGFAADDATYATDGQGRIGP